MGFYNFSSVFYTNFNPFPNTFIYIGLGYQGEDIIPFNDYNLLIDQRSLLYTINPSTNNIYIPTANMHTFNSNGFLLGLIKIFNDNKKIINDYFNGLDNSTNKYSLIFNGLNYGYIHSSFNFINGDNINN